MLIKAANELNKNLPAMVDHDIRVNSVKVFNKTIIYHATFVNYNSDEIDREMVYAAFREKIKNSACSSPMTKELFQNGGSLECYYEGKDNRYIATITITPNDCGYCGY